MLLDTGRTIVQTAHRGIILHAACNAGGNAIITFFTPFDPAPCDKKSRSEHQILFPLFGEGSGHETKEKGSGVTSPNPWASGSTEALNCSVGLQICQCEK